MNLNQLPSQTVATDALADGVAFWKLYRYRSGDVTDNASPITAYKETPDAPDALSPFVDFLRHYPDGTPFTLVYQVRNGGEKYRADFKYFAVQSAVPLPGQHYAQNAIGYVANGFREREAEINGIVEERLEKFKRDFEERKKLESKIEELQREVRENKEQAGNFDRKFELIIEKGLEFFTNSQAQPATATPPISGTDPAPNPQDPNVRLHNAMEILKSKLGDDGLLKGVETLAGMDAEFLKTFM